jgi:hypothetical protein
VQNCSSLKILTNRGSKCLITGVTWFFSSNKLALIHLHFNNTNIKTNISDKLYFTVPPLV